jgi:hypothetical protein
MTLEDRVQQLEDDRAIRDLKARYLRACDTKDVESVRDTLAREGARILYDGFPPFGNREDFVAIYAQMGCAPGMFDIHHGANGIISFESPIRATGKWSLLFHNINLASQTLTQMGVEYDDLYLKLEGGGGLQKPDPGALPASSIRWGRTVLQRSRQWGMRLLSSVKLSGGRKLQCLSLSTTSTIRDPSASSGCWKSLVLPTKSVITSATP